MSIIGKYYFKIFFRTEYTMIRLHSPSDCSVTLEYYERYMGPSGLLLLHVIIALLTTAFYLRWEQIINTAVRHG